jgi:hypothetical protein
MFANQGLGAALGQDGDTRTEHGNCLDGLPLMRQVFTIAIT